MQHRLLLAYRRCNSHSYCMLNCRCLMRSTNIVIVIHWYLSITYMDLCFKIVILFSAKVVVTSRVRVQIQSRAARHVRADMGRVRLCDPSGRELRLLHHDQLCADAQPDAEHVSGRPHGAAGHRLPERQSLRGRQSPEHAQRTRPRDRPVRPQRQGAKHTSLRSGHVVPCREGPPASRQRPANDTRQDCFY